MRANSTSLVSALTGEEKEIFLNYLKAKFPVFHNSNFFFRDFHYGLKSYYATKGLKLSYGDAEEIAREVAEAYAKDNIFIKINEMTWKVNYEAFVTTKPGDPL